MESHSVAWPTDARYELVPLFDLPEVDMSVSIRSHCVRHRTLHRIIRAVSASTLTYAGFMLYLAVSVAVFVVPAPLGRLLAVVGVVSGIWAAVLSIGNLRLDMVRVLVKTYDIWFFTTVSTLVSVLLGLLLRDRRSVLVVMSWLAFLTNIFIDASIVGMRRLWIANVISAGCYLLMAATVSISITDGLVIFDIFRLNGHAVPAISVFRDGIMSMVIVILRNLYRKVRDATKSSQVATGDNTSMIECVSFRCRLRVQASNDLRSQLSVLPSIPCPSRAADSNTTPKKTRLQFRPVLGPMNPRDTSLPVHRLLVFATYHQRAFRCLGIVGFISIRLVVLIGLMMPRLAHRRELQLLCSIGVICSVLFVSVCLAATHRQLAYAVVTSFDCVFIGAQSLVAILSLLDLFHWQPVLVTALVGDAFWVAWLLLWDALLPPTRVNLQLTQRLAACVGSGIGVTMVLAAIATFVVLSPSEVNDRAVWNAELVGQRIEFRPLSWFAGCLATILAWGIRVIWRLWQAADTELIVLDGPVVYEAVKLRIRPHRAVKHAAGATIAPCSHTESP